MGAVLEAIRLVPEAMGAVPDAMGPVRERAREGSRPGTNGPSPSTVGSDGCLGRYGRVYGGAVYAIKVRSTREGLDRSRVGLGVTGATD